jgi:hypothetical protein
LIDWTFAQAKPWQSQQPPTTLNPADVEGWRTMQTTDAKTGHPLVDPTPERSVPQRDQLRKEYPSHLGSNSKEEEQLTPPNNFDNAGRDQQQIADDNLSQYVTGRPYP